ncbi:hypothetical protein HMPREF0765_2230 [Sphingobacterium spiritivorum ATCC 33300]|uniref:Uncharacterized protein n=1 Tax=Sphingobacterium spiritivorum ATCC 33300 TaxID=525372 RepID=C2FY24_SPHSI|nr:hypothetical protein HMPREF0765_2230 [Sphingobacterium spiritivorum ATCC 33300]
MPVKDLFFVNKNVFIRFKDRFLYSTIDKYLLSEADIRIKNIIKVITPLLIPKLFDI